MNAISPGDVKNPNSTGNKEKCDFDCVQSAATDGNVLKDPEKQCQKTASKSSKRRGKKSKRKSGGKKHKGGRYKKIIKSYYELTREEKEKIDKRNSRQRRRRRVKLRKSGMPLAPLNTTQFIVNDKKCVDIYDDSSRSDSEYALDFNRMWIDVRFERLQRLSEQELVNTYINLEDEMDGKRAIHSRKIFEESTKIVIFEEEIRNLKEKNDELIRINEELYTLLESRGYVFENRQNDGNQHLQNNLSLDS
ncbi:hypothetical protein TNIN_108121 [Trichonephila inaurata madagascariensis]|uniref:Uncharacterized protein n=1 Tax=Trichonephila inaurata madagascariensis TaxID=2747483 RepID=A0A8X6WMI1_9ARAC|nr:hypothetical protein TNIN_108121 [Trichonephila inaurata madagascariensis]